MLDTNGDFGDFICEADYGIGSMYTPSGRVRTSFGYNANGSLTFTSTNPNGFIANNALKNNNKALVELIGSLSLVCVSAISYSGLVVKKRKIK